MNRPVPRKNIPLAKDPKKRTMQCLAWQGQGGSDGRWAAKNKPGQRSWEMALIQSKGQLTDPKLHDIFNVFAVGIQRRKIDEIAMESVKIPTQGCILDLPISSTQHHVALQDGSPTTAIPKPSVLLCPLADPPADWRDMQGKK